MGSRIKSMKNKYKYILALGIFVFCLFIMFLVIMKIIWPSRIHEFRKDTIYAATSNHPFCFTVSRYYLKLNSDGTYILLYDGTLGVEEDYSPEAGQPYIEYRKGIYEQKGSDYLLHATEGAYVGFEDLESVEKREIHGSYVMTEEELEEEHTQYNLEIVWKTKRSEYRIGGLAEGRSYEGGYIIYTSDREKIPESVDEFLDFYKLVEE